MAFLFYSGGVFFSLEMLRVNFRLSLFLIFIIIVSIYLRYETLTFFNDELLIKNKLGEQKIKLKDIVSMSIARNMFGTKSYYLRLKDDAVYRVFTMRNYEEFEKVIMKEADLEVYDEPITNIFTIRLFTPRYRRWKKVGSEYKYTHAHDRIHNFFYKKFLINIFIKFKSPLILLAIVSIIFILVKIFIS